MYIIRLIATMLAAGALNIAAALAQISDDVVRIGVLSNQTAVGAAASGPSGSNRGQACCRGFRRHGRREAH
jgi:hypothetical protein